MNKYDIIHINSGSPVYNAIVSMCCKRNSSSKIIVHSHNGNKSDSLKAKISRRIIEKNADAKLSCSNKASEAMFRNKDNVILIKNGIDTRQFLYNTDNRQRIRKELGVKNDEKLIGNVGRLTAQKNQLFLLDSFRDALANNDKLKLLIVGAGELKGQLLERIDNLEISKNVILLENRNDMARIYSALDLFALPSLYEGLPVSAIESQYNGLPTILSDTIDRNVAISKNAVFLDINNEKNWTKAFLELNRTHFPIIESYDIRDTSKRIEEIYEKM